MPSFHDHSLLHQSKSMPHDVKALHVHTIKEGRNESEHVSPMETKDDDATPRPPTDKAADDDKLLTSQLDEVLSLDSADDDDRNSVSLPLDHDQQLSHSQMAHSKSSRNSSQYHGQQLLPKMRPSSMYC